MVPNLAQEEAAALGREMVIMPMDMDLLHPRHVGAQCLVQLQSS